MTGPALRTWAEVSLGQVRRNYRALAQAVGSGVLLAPVVKADAYGHGAREIARALEQEGAPWLAVSCTGEGVDLRQAGVMARILVLGGLLPFEREAALHHALTPVVHSLEELREYDAARCPLAVHLDVDTGMSRLGIAATPGEIAAAVQELRFLQCEGLMSHFASAEDFTTGQTADQMARFDHVVAALSGAGVLPRILHFSSSNAIAYGLRETWHSLVRPGLAVYGYVSESVGGGFQNVEVQPVLTWYARLLKVREIAAGTTVGYRARFRAPVAMRVGTVAAGYADGIPHRLSARGSLVSAGRQLPILGAVSMDLTTVDLTLAPELIEGDAVAVLGEGMDARGIAALAGELDYSVLCGIGNRVRRVYTD